MCHSTEYEQILTQLKRQHLLLDDERVALAETINVLNKQAYEKCAANYAGHRPSLTDPQKKHLDAIFNYITHTFQSRPLKILDIGCGQGLSLEYFNNLGGTECLAVEPSQKFREILSKDIPCINCDMLELPFENNTYHAILHHGTLHHLPWFAGSHLGISKALSEAVRVLAPEGLLSIIVKYQKEAFFDETGRFFSAMDEHIIQKLLAREKVSILELQTICDEKARAGWRDWVRVQAKKKREE